MDESLGENNNKRNVVIIVGVLAILIGLIIVAGTMLFKNANVVSPIPDMENGVRVIFVSPEPSSSDSAELQASPSATPKGTPKSSPKPSPKASAKPKATPDSSASPKPSASAAKASAVPTPTP